jgi:hypothetical protein
MYTVNTQIAFNITRTAKANPVSVSSVRVIDPTGDISNASLGTNTNPTISTTGTLTFNHTPTEAGLYEYEILGSTNTIVLKNIYLLVVSESATYTNTITV